VLSTRESRLAEEKSKDAKEKTPLAALPRKLTKVLPKPAGVFSKIAKEFCKPEKFLGKPTSNVRMDTANGMQHTKNVRMHAREVSKDTKDGRMHTKEFFKVERKLRVPTKSPDKLTGFLRKVGKVLRELADVFSQQDSAAPKLSETWFIRTSFSCNISGKKRKDVFSFRNMREEKSKDTFSVGKPHPQAILHAFSAFVMKQRACMHRSVRAVDNDDSVQPTEVADRVDMARHPETCYACMLGRGRLTG